MRIVKNKFDVDIWLQSETVRSNLWYFSSGHKIDLFIRSLPLSWIIQLLNRLAIFVLLAIYTHKMFDIGYTKQLLYALGVFLPYHEIVEEYKNDSK